MFVLEKYGPLVGLPGLAEVAGIAQGTARNQISDDTFPIKTRKEGGRRIAHYQDVAAYIDSLKSLS